MMKDCVILNGQIINIGPWDYQIKQVQVDGDEENPVYEDRESNPFPVGATIEQRDVDFSDERGWYEVGTVQPPSVEEQLKQVQLMMNTILMG
jgi:hypothetical protein